MPKNRFVELVIPLYFEGHAYPQRLAHPLEIAAPNGTQPVWSFGQTEPQSTANMSVAMSKKMPSSLILPVVPGVGVPTRLPPCPSLRNEPCGAYKPFTNG
jgi:hypothetical protein